MLKRICKSKVIAGALADDPLVFVDVGAAVGIEEPWRRLAQADFCQVVAFEPHPENFADIERMPGGQYFQTAISDFVGSAPFHMHGTGSSLKDRSFELGVDAPIIEVEVSTLEHLRTEGVIRSLDIIKTDVELNDFEAVKSAGKYLTNEVLAVQSEFSMMGGGTERGFADFLALMAAHGFMLADVSLKRSGNGTIKGGDCLFLKDHFALMQSGSDRAMLKTKLVKLLVICCAINNARYAYYVVRSLEDGEIVPAADLEDVKRSALAKMHLPELLPRSGFNLKISSLVGALAQLIAGQFWSAKSSFEDNRLRRIPVLFVSKKLLPGFAVRRVMERYERVYQIEKRRAGGAPD